MISGTSVDGIDVAVADLRLESGVVELAPVRHAEVDLPADLRARLLAALPPGPCDAAGVCALDTGVGQAFGAAAAALAGAVGGVDLVASLGQTLYHWVDGDRCLGTLQLGQPAWIAEATGLPVVSDLRARDVAAGGHGAPLAGVLDRLLLAGDPSAAALNLGGIANATVAGTAFDTGPANALLDHAARTRLGLPCDTGGAVARRGRVRADLLDVLLTDPYYAAPPPKSTGKEHFGAEHLDAALARVPAVDDADLLATLVQLTATTVARALAPYRPTRVLASGGGVRNPALMDALAVALGPAELTTTDALGLPAEAKEAYLTALLGFLTWCGIPVDTGTGGGARVLGSVTPGRDPARWPEPVAGTANALRIAPAGRGSPQQDSSPPSTTPDPVPAGGPHARP
ncbi:anhydro-N-acetylmuramic acid kinase [Actinokineospora bangkokensis]|uniref:Anhydro-N-acetylmuramic acid kinase n=1 Tax=Actinokineospora bangkokensis TaxID=1193682 RepID=A0A1Q9LI60_9PSEU|nr:anhydro-N-acetylmuramic acid kinase [Actinokineospora bangkokensis]OLR91669.1 anhydro-N-acetylmuramic acid kinase [Actinokineospora bangkokensis]